MNTKNLIKAFSALGKRLHELSEENLELLIARARAENAWFTDASIRMALNGIVKFLDEETLIKWASSYKLENHSAKTIGVVMAGNIPLVGFHDFLAVLISGNSALIKLSSKDAVLIRQLAAMLIEIEPSLEQRIIFTERLKDFDAVIATGSDNSARYFEYYFAKYPNIIRKNRTSCAILQGNETKEQFLKLGEDVFSYFGLGCRNVSKLFVPENYDFSPLLSAWESFAEISNHHKYHNNYDYQKSIMLVNGVRFLDNEVVMITESEKLVSPISVIYYEYYSSVDNLNTTLLNLSSKLQCIVGKVKPATIPFGQSQYPEIWDYADQVDTLKFLSELK
jgi:hypothetical protein